jgi:tetratricopeptide (TPR) repeat protein
MLFSVDVSAQSAKKFYKTGLAFAKSGNYGDAITNYTKALEMDPEYVRAYEARAKVYASQEKYEEAAKDYDRASSLEPDNEHFFYYAAKMYYNLGNYDSCLIKADKAISIDKKYVDPYKIKTQALIAQDKIGAAEKVALQAFELRKDYDTYFNLGLIYYKQKRYTDAEKHFTEAHKQDGKKVEPLLMLAQTYYDQERYDEAINTVYQVFSIDAKNKDAFLLRAESYEKLMRYQDAINDLSQIIVYHPKADFINDIYMKRGDVYFEFNQHINAINDYTKVILNDPERPEAYLHRAQAYEVIRSNDEAIKDYEKLVSMNLKGDKYKALLMAANVRLYELKREEDDPVLVINNPKIRKEGELEVIKGSENVTIEGVVKDASAIKYLKVNGQEARLTPRSGKYDFTITVPVKGVTEFDFEVSDEYDNITKRNYVKRITEVDPPQITLITPVASDDGQIYLESDEPRLYIEGTAIDASKIQNIMIDSLNASFSPSVLNPSFSATIDITNKSKIWIEATDIYGNKKRYEYLLNREGIDLTKNNPMGKTWVVFIENSNYESFASLDGPTKDVSMMKAALSKYKIHNIIHKRDMTKAEMERFFSIELRDLVRKNHVNSIIVWYAGHGKFINNTGYWIPVDAKRDDEFTYFNINQLKASMQSYSDVVTHTLVVTDACESGPTFYQDMRS